MEATAVKHTASAGFADLDEEVELDSIPMRGELPEWLRGSLIRVTPAKFDTGAEHIRHWFDGLAMLNRFGFADGRVSYSNRFLRGDSWERAQRGERIGQGFATDPCRSIFKRVQAIFSPDFYDNANVNLMRLGERYVAMTETPLPVEFDAETLATLRRAGKAPGEVTTAHPHHDRERGEAVNYAVHMSGRPTYRVYATNAAGDQRVVAETPVREPAYMHSFAMTERYVVLAEYPLVVNPLRLALSAESFIESYRWKPERGTRFRVIDRHTGEERATATAEPFFCFHHVNAWEEDGEVVLDLIAYDDASVIDVLYIDKLRAEPGHAPSQLRRYRVPLDGGHAEGEVLLDRHIELPRIDYGRVNGKPYRVLYAGGTRGEWHDELVRHDVVDGSTRVWHEDGCHPGEPVYVARPGAEREDDGVVLSVVFDAASERSFLLVLDAASFDELARAEAPHHVPFGFHGQFFS